MIDIIYWKILIGLCLILSLMFSVITVNYSLKDSTKIKNKMNMVLRSLFLMVMFIFIEYFTYKYLEPIEINKSYASIENNGKLVELKINQDLSKIKTNKIEPQKAKYVECWPVKEDNKKTQTTNNDGNKNGKIIGDKDSKIYHVPGSSYYQRELQKMSNNEYFNTVAEAEAAGYRAPKN